MERSGLAGTSVAAGATLERANGEPLVSVDQLQSVFAASNGKPVELTWKNEDGTSATTSAAPSAEYQTLFGPTLPKDAATKEPRTVQAGLAGLLPLARVTAVQPDSPNVGLLMPGDVLLRVATTAGPSLLTLGEVLRQYKGNGVPLELLRNGERVQLLGRVGSNGMLGVAISGAWDLPMIAGAVKMLGPPPGVEGDNRRGPASALDMLPLSTVTSVGGTPVSTWLDMRSALQQAIERAGGPGGERDGRANERAGDMPAEISVEIAWDMPTPGRDPTTGMLRLDREDARVIAGLSWASPIDPVLFEPEMVTLQADGNPLTAVSMGFRQTSSMIKMTYLTIDRLVRGSVGVEQLRGPVGIVHLGSTVADRGAMYLVFFLAAISVNLAVLNFLPLPIVDGGLFLYLLYERITGKPPSVAFQNAAILVGLCLLGGIFLLTFYQDVMRLVGN
jgi:regulator of sigma E protease